MNDLALIIGAGIGGLTTGALLCKRGWRVIILEQASKIGGCCSTYTSSGFKFDIGATLFPDILWSGLDLVSRELELELDRIFVDPFSQICIPGHRISLYRDSEITKEEWAREFPFERNKISDLFRYLKKIDTRIRYQKAKDVSDQTFCELDNFDRKQHFWHFLWPIFRYQRKSANSALNHILKKSQARISFDLQTLFWGQTEFSKANLAYVALVMGLPFYGGFCLKGGGDALCHLLARYIHANRGEIRLNSQVKEVMVRKRKAIGIMLNTGEILEGRCYIANTTPWGLYENLLSDGFSRNRMIRRLSKAPYPNAIFSIFLGIKENCLHSQMGHKVFLLPKKTGKETNTTGPLFISLTPKEDVGRAPVGCRAMSVFHYTSSEGWKNGQGYQKNKELMTQRILKSLKKLIPFLEEGLCVCETATPLTYEKLTLRPGGIVNGIPHTMAIIYNKALQASTCYKDLFMISDCTSPGLGVEGICQASFDLANRICQRYE